MLSLLLCPLILCALTSSPKLSLSKLINLGNIVYGEALILPAKSLVKLHGRWSLFQKTGGLGAINLYTQNVSLLLEHLHKFYNKVDVPWVHLIRTCYYPNGDLPLNINRGSFWWKDILKSLTSFKCMATATIVDGSTNFFWNDMWNGRSLSSLSSQTDLCSFAIEKHVTVHSIILSEDLLDHFHLPLSVEAFSQFQQLDSLVQDIPIQIGSDVWSYIWGSTQFSQSRLICISQEQEIFTLLINGSGSLIVSQNENSSSGSY